MFEMFLTDNVILLRKGLHIMPLYSLIM